MIIGIIFLLLVMVISQLRCGEKQIVWLVLSIFLRIFPQKPGKVIYIPFPFVFPGMIQHSFVNLMGGKVPLLCPSLIPIGHKLS